MKVGESVRVTAGKKYKNYELQDYGDGKVGVVGPEGEDYGEYNSLNIAKQFIDKRVTANQNSAKKAAASLKKIVIALNVPIGLETFTNAASDLQKSLKIAEKLSQKR